MDFDIFNWKEVSNIKLNMDSGMVITYDNLQETMIRIEQNTTSQFNTMFGYTHHDKSIKLLLKSSDLLNMLYLRSGFTLDIECKERIIHKYKVYKLLIETNSLSLDNGDISINMDNYRTSILDCGFNISNTRTNRADGNFINFNLIECGLKYTKEDDNKKIIVNEPSVVYIIKDKETKKKYRGYARCLLGDKFDESIGIGIAKLKAEIKKKEYQLSELTQ